MWKFLIFFFVFLVVVGGAAALIFFTVRKSESRNKYALAGVLIVFVLLAIVLPTIVFGKIFTIWELFGQFTRNLNNLGISIWLVKALAAVAVVPFLWAIKDAFSFNKTRRMRGGAIISLYFVAYFIMMYFATKNVYIDHESGEGTKWVYIDESGQVREYDSEGYDIETGRKLVKADSTILEQIKHAKKIEMENRDLSDAFFHPVTGRPLKYYAINQSGIIDIYNEGGFDEITREKYSLVSPEIVQRFFKEQDSLEAIANSLYNDSLQLAAEAEEERLKAVAERIRKERELERERYLTNLRNKYLNPSIKQFASKSDIAYVLSANARKLFSEYSSLIKSSLDRMYSGKGRTIQDFPFSNMFISDGYLDSLKNGNSSILNELKVSRKPGTIMILDIREGEVTTSGALNMKSMSFAANFIEYDFSGNKKDRLEPIIFKGVGKTDDVIYKQAVNDLITHLQQ